MKKSYIQTPPGKPAFTTFILQEINLGNPGDAERKRLLKVAQGAGYKVKLAQVTRAYYKARYNRIGHVKPGSAGGLFGSPAQRLRKVRSAVRRLRTAILNLQRACSDLLPQLAELEDDALPALDQAIKRNDMSNGNSQ